MSAATACRTCGALMTAGSAFCLYCGQRSLLHAEAVRDFYRFEHGRAMRCPVCQGALQVRPTGDVPGLSVAHCPSCQGMFFPPGVAEQVQQAVCKPALREDAKSLRRLRKLLAGARQRASAGKCPICEKALTAGPYSTVFPLQLARCEAHGLWMEQGQFGLLKQWREAGGQLADPHLTPRLAGLELEIGARRLVLWLLLGVLLLIALWTARSHYALRRSDAYVDCTEAFDRSAGDASAPDFALRRARSIHACTQQGANALARKDEAKYQEVLDGLPHAPCRYVGAWIAATNETRDAPATVDDALATARVTLNGDGTFMARTQSAREPQQNGYWGEHKGRLVFIRDRGYERPDIDAVSEVTDQGFLLTERNGRRVRYFLESRKVASAGCVP